MLTCRQMTELANGYLERELPMLTWAQVRMHLLMCKHCPKYIDQLAGTVTLLRTLPHDTPPTDVEDTLVRVLRRHRAARLPE